MEAAARSLPPGQSIVVYKNNSDRKGNSYGTHENYLMDRSAPFGRVVQHVMPHFITRQIFAGAGKVGTEAPSTGGLDVPFQLSQRADFFEEEVGLETTLKRPIVNTRDEPHADAQKYRRLHVIVGDANLSEVATFLKVGVTALVLCMIEDDWFGDRDFTLETPVAAMRKVSSERSLFARVGMQRLVSDDDVAEAMSEPPRDTRAYFRGKCLQKWASSVAAANWDSLVFDLGGDPLRRVAMMEPLRGTAELVDTLF